METRSAPQAFLNLESLTAPPAAPTEGSTVPQMFLNLESLHAPIVALVEESSAHQMLPIDEFVTAKASPKEPCASDASTTGSADEDQSLTTPPSGLSDDEAEPAIQDTSATLKISLTDTLGLWSIGSAAHDSGTCKPCAFLWKDVKKPGCENGMNCLFCHLCPPGETKRRKKQKMFMRKVAKNLQYTQQFAGGFEPHFDAQYQYENQVPAGYGTW